jgi:hypothetical protein
MFAVLAMVLVPAALFGVVFGMAWIEATLGGPSWHGPDRRGPLGS